MTNGVSVAVTAPRRYGKTSLIGRAVDLVERRRGAVITINLMHCPSLGVFATRLVAGAYDVRGARWHRRRQGLAEFIGRLRLQPTVVFDEDGKPRFGFGAVAERDALRVLEDVYGLLADLAAKRPGVLVLDEFQAVGDLGGGIAPGLKALGDKHPEVSLVLAGSRQHLMEALVLSSGAPLYNMAERLALGPIEDSAMVGYLIERAGSGGKSMGEEAARGVVAVAGPVPYDIQRLAYELFDVSGTSVGPEDVATAMMAIVRREESDFVERLARVGASHRRVLVAIARRRSVDQPYTAEFAREVGYAGPPSVRRAVQSLGVDETLVIRAGSLSVGDPFFAEWLRQL